MTVIARRFVIVAGVVGLALVASFVFGNIAATSYLRDLEARYPVGTGREGTYDVVKRIVRENSSMYDTAGPLCHKRSIGCSNGIFVARYAGGVPNICGRYLIFVVSANWYGIVKWDHWYSSWCLDRRHPMLEVLFRPPDREPSR